MRLFFCILSLLCTRVSAAQSTYFPPLTPGVWDTMSLEGAGFAPGNERALYDFLDRTNTDAFLLLKDGKIVLERYFGDFTADSPHLWNSAGKSLTAFAVGIAEKMDSLSIEDRTSDYFGSDWTACPETDTSITIRHQLTMTTGLDNEVDDVFCTDAECLVCRAAPGARWAYHNGPYTLLTNVIEAATGTEINTFIDENLQVTTGITGRYINLGYNRVYASNARAFARFGLLVAAGGGWDGGAPLVDSTYFNAMVNSSQELNPAYGYLWWLNGKASFQLPGLQRSFPGPLLRQAPQSMIAAIGKDGQILNIVEEEGLVLVRMGSNAGGDFPVPTMYNDSIWAYVNDLRPLTDTQEPAELMESSFVLAPNPARASVRLTSDSPLQRVDLFSGGRRLRTLKPGTHSVDLDLTGLPTGVIYVRVESSYGVTTWKRLVHTR